MKLNTLLSSIFVLAIHAGNASGQNLPATLAQPLLAATMQPQQPAELPAAQPPPTSTPAIAPYPRQIMNLSIGASWAMANLNNATGGDKAILWGFYVAPTVAILPHLGARFDVAQDYDTHVGQQELRDLRLTAGPVVSYPVTVFRRTVTPFLYAEGGATRISKPDSYVTQEAWRSATVDCGIGLRLPITRRFDLEAIPAEYSTFKLDNGSWMTNVGAKAGIVVNFFGPPRSPHPGHIGRP